MGFEPTCPCGQLHFECSSLQPLRYASMYKYSLFGTNHMISSAAPSTTRTTLRIYFNPYFLPKNCSKIHWGENRRESKKYSILDFSVLRCINGNQGDENHRSCRNFESVPLRPLRYISIFTVEYNNNTKSGGGQAKFAAKRPSPKESIDTNRPA